MPTNKVKLKSTNFGALGHFFSQQISAHWVIFSGVHNFGLELSPPLGFQPSHALLVQVSGFEDM
jgi:hypothetical protein